MVNLFIMEAEQGHCWDTKEGVPNCFKDSGRLPRELWAKAGATGGNGKCGMAWAWEDHGKILTSHGYDEGEGPGGQPIEREVTKRQGVTGTSLFHHSQKG